MSQIEMIETENETATWIKSLAWAIMLTVVSFFVGIGFGLGERFLYYLFS